MKADLPKENTSGESGLPASWNHINTFHDFPFIKVNDATLRRNIKVEYLQN